MNHTTRIARIIARLRDDQEPLRPHEPAYYAELRTGRMYHGDDKPPMSRADWWIIVVCAAILGALIGGMTMPDVPIPSDGFGHEYCKGKC